MEQGRSLLVVEQGDEVRTHIEETCAAQGFSIETARDAEHALMLLDRALIDAVVVDVSPGRLDGFSVCRRLHEAGVVAPIVVVSSLTDTVDAVLAFALGADGFVRKPYAARELVARVAAHIRRVQRTDTDIVLGPLRISPSRRCVWRDGEEVPLTRTEFDIVLSLAQHAGRAVSRDELIAITPMRLAVETRSVDAHIHRLRRKLEPNADRPTYIQSVNGHGYRLVTDQGRFAGAA